MEISNNTTKNQATKNISIADRLFDDDYLESLKKVFDIIVRSNDVKHAQILVKVLKEAMAARKRELEAVKEINDFYKKIVIKLKFIALPLLDDADIMDLVKNYFTWQFRLPDYDIMEKLSAKLLNIVVLEDRDKFKAGLKGAILNNKETITSRAEIRTVADWLKNYISKLGLDIADNLKRTQYLVDLTKVKGLDEDYVNRLKILFNFYESLKFSSLTPLGFDEEIPMVMKGKSYIFRRGRLDPVGEIKIRGTADGGVEADKNEIQELEALKQMLSKYPEGSLERKAIEDEIAKLKTGGGEKKVGQ
ncbi:MAG: hypothetical protein PHQ42_01625 [Patescibacteria group bacterium]|nr:hypothetical protein [Patescibacteria group bacterium]